VADPESPPAPAASPRSSTGRRLAIAAVAATLVVVIGFLVMRAAQQPARPVEDRAASLVADCSVDVTEQLTELISSAEPGTTVQLQRDGCYRVDGTIGLEDVVGLTIDGNGATLDGSQEAGARSRRHIRIRGGGDLVIENLRLVGSRCTEPPCAEGSMYQMERQHGIAVENVDGMTIRGVTITNVWGDFVYMTAKGEGPQPKDVVIRDNFFKNSGRQGIAAAGVVGLRVENNWILDAGRSVFDFEAEGGGARDVTLANNQIVRPDNATLNVGCADRGTGVPLNEGPIRLIGNRIYQAPLEVDTACGGNSELTAKLDVVVEDNEDGLEAEPPPFPGG
jgi:hypothetical protein